MTSLLADSPDVDATIRTTICKPRPALVEHLLEALSLALCYDAQKPPNPITRAALQHAVQDALAEIDEMIVKPR